MPGSFAQGSAIKSMQTGTSFINPANALNSITISPVNVAKSIVTAFSAYGYTNAYFVDSTHIIVSLSAQQNVNWTVTEFN